MANVIGFDPVAYSVDGGRHPADLLRLVAYASTNGEEGIVQPGDCKPHQLGTAGPQVVIDPGALLIRNGSVLAFDGQTYVANARSETRLDVAPTTVSGSRSDLVIVRIEDPQYPRWPDPPVADAPNFQYTMPVIIQNVPAGTLTAGELNLGYSAYAVARIDIPGNTTNITNEMIKDLRRVANPRRTLEVVGINNDGVGHTLDPAGSGSSSFETWPLGSVRTIYIPPWATRLKYQMLLGQAIPVFGTTATTGYWRLNIGNGALLGDSVQWEVDSANATNPQTIANSDYLNIPAGLRGTNVNFKTEARRLAGDGGIKFASVSSLSLLLFFEEAPA